jgi:hypothetical protein
LTLDEIARRNYTEGTTRAYLRIIEDLARYFHRSPDQLGPEHLREYTAHLFRDRKLSDNSVNQIVGALRFFFRKVLKRCWTGDEMPYPKKKIHLPIIWSPEEVTSLIDAAPIAFYRTILMTLYGTGVRRAECAALKLTDIDSARMVVHVQDGKGDKDRDIVLRTAIVCGRTSALGGHIDECSGCGQRAISFNSCRNRHCPKCQSNARDRWLDARRRELLPVPYAHVVFTLPGQLAPLALQNKSEIYGLLFRASAETLLTVAWRSMSFCGGSFCTSCRGASSASGTSGSSLTGGERRCCRCAWPSSGKRPTRRPSPTPPRRTCLGRYGFAHSAPPPWRSSNGLPPLRRASALPRSDK